MTRTPPPSRSRIPLFIIAMHQVGLLFIFMAGQTSMHRQPARMALTDDIARWAEAKSGDGSAEAARSLCRVAEGGGISL
jgi:hypothetical protein